MSRKTELDEDGDRGTSGHGQELVDEGFLLMPVVDPFGRA
jgi:hypothetical protein